MYIEFKPTNRTQWELMDDKIIYGGAVISFETIAQMRGHEGPSLFKDGTIIIERTNGSILELAIPNSQKNSFDTAVEYITCNCGGESARKKAQAMQAQQQVKADYERREAEKRERERRLARKIEREESNKKLGKSGLLCCLQGCRGRLMEVYKNKCVIITDITLGSILTANALDGEKTIFYKDVIGVQFKKSSMTIGYLQLETATAQMNNLASNTFSENTFTFEGEKMNGIMIEIKKYIVSRIEGYKYDTINEIPEGLSENLERMIERL